VLNRARYLLAFLFITALVYSQLDSSLYRDLRWRMIGPHRGGRTVAISGVPGRPNVFYIGVNNGGVWKTTDYGRTWKPIFDDQPTGSIGALALAPSNPDIIYVGSGEGLRRPDLSVGDGIYKSSDGGRTWKHLGLRDGQQIGSILVDPRDPNRVFAAVLGHPYGPNSERGICRSLDGGETFTKVLFKNDDTGGIDLAFDPSNSSTVFAVMWASRRPPWTTGNSYDAPGSGLYKSTDGGSTWRQITKGLPTSEQGLGRIGITVAPSDPKRMYALVDAPELGGLYRSDDAGESWQRVNTDKRIWGRGSDFAWVRVHPKIKDTIYIPNIAAYRSTDAGKTFMAFKGAPGGDDYHSVWINPDNPQIIAMASDQGAVISVNGGETWSSWYNQPTAQFYHVITDNQFPYWVYGGQQESGSAAVLSRSDTGQITFREWHPVGVEEYGYVAPDPLNPGIIYGGKATRYDTTTGQTQDISPVVIRTGKYRFNRTAPLMFSPADPRVLLLGSNVLFKTTNGGHSWDIISPDLTRDDPGVPGNLGVFVNSDPARGKHRGVIYSLAPSPKDANLIWAGTDDGLIHVTHDGGKTWQNVTPPDLTAWSKVAQLDAGHFDTETAYAAVNRFRLDDLHPYIYRTHDGGETWQKIVAGLPDEPVNTVREDPMRQGLLFAGTERSVYVSFDDGDHWQSLKLNLPATSIRDLVIHQDDIVVGTHGRSFWILDNITPLRQLDAKVASAEAYLFAPQLTYRMRRNNNTDTPLPPEEPAGQNPPDGAMIDYFLKSAATEPVKIEILDRSGRTVRTFSSADKPEAIDPDDYPIAAYWMRPARTVATTAGMHRFVWDLRYTPPAALDHEFPISAILGDTPREPLGVIALPGQYTVKLTVGSQTLTQPLMLKMDPRVKASAEDLTRQFELASQIVAAMQQDCAAIEQVNAFRKQISGHSAAAELERKAAALLGTTGSFGAPPQDSLKRLNTQFAELLAATNGADAAPTTQLVEAFHERNELLHRLLGQVEQLKQEIADR
jgi:photosystem II stability/assembly factor-like uncharacterized protein